MNLQRVGEHDEDNNGEAADGTGSRGGVHLYNVAANVVAIGEVPCDAGKNVEGASAANRGKDYSGSAEVRVVGNFIED